MSDAFRDLDSSVDLASQGAATLECGMQSSDTSCSSSQLELRSCQVRRTFSEPWRPVYPGRTRSMVCRTSAVACLFIICVHLLFVWSVDVAPTIDRIVRQGASLVAPVSHQEALSRVKRHLVDENRHLEARDDDVTHVKDDALEKSKLSHTSSSSSPSTSSICRSGHIQGFSAVCEAQPCLRRLHRPNNNLSHPPSSSSASSSSPSSSAAHEETSAQVLRRISHISGRLDAVHLSLVPFLSQFQWNNGLYGSVGEFGVALGKFTTLLSTYTDVESGERLFVCDCFNRSTSGGAGHHGTIAGLSSLQIFTTHMRDFGFEEEESAGPRRLHLFRGSSSTLDRRIFSAWDLPQFRLISIDADLDRLSVLSDLEMASCLLRDGGLVIVNGVDDHETKQLTTWTMDSYFRKHGQSALTPILSTGNKLYLTTTNWRRKYIEALTNDVILTHSGLIESAFIAP